MREERQHEDAGLWRDRSTADLRGRSFSHDLVAERYRRQQSHGTLPRTRSKNQRLLHDPNLQDKLFEQDAPDTRLSTTQSFRSASGGGGGIAGGASFRSTSGGGGGGGGGGDYYDGGALGNTTSRNSFAAGHRSSTFVARRPRHSGGGGGGGGGASPRALQWPSPQRSQRSASVPTTANMQQLLDRCAEQKNVGKATGILALEGVSTVGCVLRARWRVEVKGVAVSEAHAAGSVLRWWCDERELVQLRGQEEMPLTTEVVGCVVSCTLSPTATVADHGSAVTVSGETVRAAAAHAVSRSDAAPTTPRQLLPSFRASDGPVRVGETIRLPHIDRPLLIEHPSWHFCPPGGSDGEEAAAASAFSAPASVEELCVVGAPCVTVGPQHVGLALEVRLTFAGALPAKAALGVVCEAEEGAAAAVPAVSPPAAAAGEWAPLEEVLKRKVSLRNLQRVASTGGSSRSGGGGEAGGAGDGGKPAVSAGSEEEEQILRFTSRGGRAGSVVSSVPSGHARGVVPGANPRKPSAASSAGQARRHSNKPKQNADSKCGCVVA